MSAIFQVRRATPEDESRVEELLLASYPALMCQAYDQAILEAALPFMTRANPALLSSGTYYLVENDQGLAIGCGGWSWQRAGSTELVPKLAHIRHFATRREWARRGVGRELYKRCEDDARAAGVRRFECYASLNADGFYAALGFEPVRRIGLRIGPVMLPSILMERAI